MLSQMYYFGGSIATLDKIKVTLGWSVVNEEFVMVGHAYDLAINNGRLELFQGNRLVAYTGKVVSKDVYMDEPCNMPFYEECNGKQVTAAVMVVYTTESGSRYAFVPGYSPLVNM